MQSQNQCFPKITFSYCIIFRDRSFIRSCLIRTELSFAIKAGTPRGLTLRRAGNKKLMTHHRESLPVMGHQSRITNLKETLMQSQSSM